MANHWTEEQQQAIDIEGCNVLVSAGAGSGKTAVLSERVLRKVKMGTKVNEMLILTFTKAAAKEMKDRIRTKLIDNNLLEEVSLLDSAYITTFDSYSLSLVKKYHAILNISDNINVADSVLLDIIKRDTLESIMEEYYEKKDPLFKEMVCHFSLKDDKELIDSIIRISDKLDLKYNRCEWLENYMDNFYSPSFINNIMEEYQKIVLEEKESFNKDAKELKSLLEDKHLTNFIEKVDPFIESTTYNEIARKIKELTLPRAVGYSEEEKMLNDKLKSSKEVLAKLCLYDNLSCIKDEVMSTYNDCKVFTSILLELDKKVMLKKEKEELYSFNDISHLAIKLVKENEDIRREVKASFKEILIDEYQDTSDNQELLISLISNNNIYAVGDIKQSIYRFRNANPNIFKEKYENFSKDNSLGVKIDLNKNFRSRFEVLENINMLFESVMTSFIGGADYKKSHLAIFGNTSYNEEGKTSNDYNLEVYTYNKDETLSNIEKEAFIIAEDIKNKIESKYQIFDKDKKLLREANYDDFVILLDKKKDFDTYKKIFEYMNIPLTILKEESINNTDDFLLIHNLFKLILKVYEKNFDVEFKYSFTSVARSFLFHYSDEEIFTIFTNNTFMDTSIVKKALEICKKIESLPLQEVFLLVLSEYDYLEKILSTDDIVSKENVLEYLNDFIMTFQDGDIYKFMYFLDNVCDRKYDIKYDNSISINNTVKIMSIHKSKGLEFPICYFASLENRFNKRDQLERIIFDNKYGLIFQVMDEESKDTASKILFKRYDTVEEVSERIRLFYVALTRCKEKLIIVCPKVEEDNSIPADIVDNRKRRAYNSFYSILKSIWYKLSKYIKEIEDKEYSKDYLYKIKKSDLNFSDASKIEVHEEKFNLEKQDSKHYSKENKDLIEKENYSKMEFGTNIHRILENIDFKNPDYENIEDPFIKNKIKRFIESPIIRDNLDGIFYKEYEFIYEGDDGRSHGIIDLMIEKRDLLIIIDYKIKDIEDPSYKKQLKGYLEYMKSITDKRVEAYLYSIVNEELKSI